MKLTDSYRRALFHAMLMHIVVAVLLCLEPHSSKRPVLEQGTQAMHADSMPAKQEVVHAVSIDNQELNKAVSALKEEREQTKKIQMQKQQELNNQLEQAKAQKIKEQQHIAHLKEQADKMMRAQKKQEEEQKKHLEELAIKKALEEKRIEALKAQKEQLAKQKELEQKKLQEAQKVADLKKQKEAQLQKERQESAQKAQQLKAAQAAQKLEAAKQAEHDAQTQARLAGEIDKYKSLILNAIGRHWILPENTDSSLSSQFRIRLAPDGTVLEVTLMKSSGEPLLDRSAQSAIFKASPLPVPSDPQTFNMFRDISLTVRPEQIRG